MAFSHSMKFGGLLVVAGACCCGAARVDAGSISTRAQAVESALRGAPIGRGTARVFEAPREAAPVQMNGFCQREADAVACMAPPCCCWSTYSVPTHALYPNQAQAVGEQHCYNPPANFHYIPEPGFTHDDGQYRLLWYNNLPRLEGRRLCCLVAANDPLYYSMREPSAHQDHPPTTTLEPPPTTAPPQVFDTTTTGTTWDPDRHEDYETINMEYSAYKYKKAADELGESAKSLNGTLEALDHARRLVDSSPELARKKRHIERMKEAIHTWAHKRWQNLDAFKNGNESAMILDPVKVAGVVHASATTLNVTAHSQ